jgi:glycosyltransferase involved in cell wall biosynthesis
MQKNSENSVPRILVLDVNVTSAIGGVQNFTSRLISQLNHGFHFTIVSGSYNFYLQEQHVNCTVLMPNKINKVLGLLLQRIYAFKNRKVILFLSSGVFLFYIYFFSRQIKQYKGSYDLILSEDDYYIGEVITILAKLRREPIVHIIHSAEPLDLTGVPFFKPLALGLLRFVAESRNLFFSALNKYVAEEFSQIFPQHVEQIGIGVDTAEYSPVGFDSKQNIILYLGRLNEKQKNISLLIRAFALLRNTSYTLLIVGDGNDREFYLGMINKLGITNKCKLTGYVDNKERSRLLSISKIFVNPSIREGQSNAVLEAMSAGCAVVAVDNHGTRGTIINGYNGIIVDNDVNSLRNTLERLIFNEEELKKLSDNGRMWVVKNHSISIIAKEYQKLFNKILGDKFETS